MKTIYTGLLTAIGIIGLSSLSWGQCFESPRSFSSSSDARLVVADFTADGNPDLATYNSGIISLFLGNGSGQFGSAINSTVDGFSARYTVGDFNGDGKPDLVGADSDTISVVLNQGNGLFKKAVNTPVYFDASHRPSSIGVGDFNKDNKLDVVVISPFANKVSLLLGDGLGGFSTTTSYNLGAEGSNPQVLQVGDFNADGKPDLVTGNSVATAASGLSILLGNGIGGFSSVSTVYLSTANLITMVSGDFNGDSKLDIAVGLQSPLNKGISVLLGKGDGSFAGGGGINLGQALVPEVFVGDFNVDGKADLAAPNYYGQSVSTWLATGDGMFGTSTAFDIGNTPSSLVVGDFNKDGKSDLAVSGRNTGTFNPVISVLLNCTTALTTTNLTLITPVYDCTSGQLTAQTTGGNGAPIEYRIAGIRDYGTAATFTVPAYQRNGTTFTIEARQSGAVVSAPFSTTCQPVLPTAPATLTITSFTCNTTNSVLNGVNFVIGYTDGSFAPALPDLFINGVTDTGKLGQPYALTFDVNQSVDAIQDQATRSTYFVWNFRQACALVGNQPLNLATPTFTCATGQLTLTPTGGNGQPIEYRVAGLRDWASSNTFTVPAYQRSSTTFSLQARQNGQVVSVPFTATCPVSTRLASPETASPFAVVVYPNPVGEQFTVEVNGASGQLVRFHLTTLSGQTVVEQRVPVSSDAHTETLRLPASGAGLYLLQVSTDSQNRTLKVLKP